MGVFTQPTSNIKGFACKFACKCAFASCVKRPLQLIEVFPPCQFPFNMGLLCKNQTVFSDAAGEEMQQNNFTKVEAVVFGIYGGFDCPSSWLTNFPPKG